MIMTAGLALLMTVPGHDMRLAAARTELREGQRLFNSDSVLSAFGHLQDAMTELHELNDSDGLFEAVVYMSMLYDQIGQKSEAHRLLRTVEFRDVGNYKAYSSQYYLRMMAYYSMLLERDYERSEHFTNMAIDFSRRKYPADKAYVYMDMANLAELHIMHGDPEKARQVISDIESSEPVEYQLYRSQVYYCRGMMYEMAGHADSAYACYEQCLTWSRRYNTRDNELNVLRMMVRADSAAADMHRYIAHRRSIDSLMAEQNGSEMYYRMAVMKEQHKTELMKQEGTKSKTINTIVLVALSVLLLMTVTGFVLIYKNAKTKQRLAVVERQRLDAAIEMEKLEKELLRLKMEQSDRKLTKAHNENLAMSLRIAAGQRGEADRLHPLERTLKDIDNDFIHRVEHMFPALSRNDMRLMSLIKSGMASNEIAALLNITVESLHKSRYRLRKKLGLRNGQDLETFIDSLIHSKPSASQE